MVKPPNKRDYRFENRKALQQPNILECLTSWRDANGLVKLVDSVLDSSEQDKLGYGGVHIEEKDEKVSSNFKQCLRKIANGHFTSVLEVLRLYGVAPIMHIL